MLNQPVLTDIEVGLKGDEIEIHPFPIPDLFIGAPVVIAAEYTADECPKQIMIRGFNPYGDQEAITCKVEERNDLPVEKIFIKQKIDLLTADAWLDRSKKLENKVRDISIDANMVSMYTDIVMFETSKLMWEDAERKVNDSLESDNPYDTELRRKKEKLMTKMKNNKKTVAALAIGGTAAVVTVGFGSFGDIESGLIGTPVFGLYGNGWANGGPIEDCDCYDCECECDCNPDCVIM